MITSDTKKYDMLVGMKVPLYGSFKKSYMTQKTQLKDAWNNKKEEWDILLSFAIMVVVILLAGWWGVRALYISAHPRTHEPVNKQQQILRYGEYATNIIDLGGVAKLYVDESLFDDPTTSITLIKDFPMFSRPTNPPNEIGGYVISTSNSVPNEKDIYKFQMGKSIDIEVNNRTFKITLDDVEFIQPYNFKYHFRIVEK